MARLLSLLAPLVFAALVSSRVRSPKSWRGMTVPKKRTVDSYLFDDSHFGGELFEEDRFIVQDIIELLHQQQHPMPVSSCGDRRLLVLQMSTTPFEGTGSILKQVMLALAVAMHSNRTLVWGVGLPYIFEYSRDLWQDKSSAVEVGDKIIDCSGANEELGGPFGCFFQPISHCAMTDASPDALQTFVENSFNDSAQMILAETRKGPALYHPPAGLFDYVRSRYSKKIHKNKKNKEDDIEEVGGGIRGTDAQLFSAAVAAYLYRLQPYFHSLMKEQYSSHFVNQQEEPVWGIHVRHGDVKALAHVYSYKQVFEVEQYYEAAVALSHTVQQSPRHLLISTDDHLAEDPGYLPAVIKKYSRLRQMTDVTPQQPVAWYHHTDQRQLEYPDVITVNNSGRYRTEYGSHTVAANGGCVNSKDTSKGAVCGLNHEAVTVYNSMSEHDIATRPQRLFRVLLESIEDMYLLSLTDCVLGQGSSHFSTMAAMLLWARTGAAHGDLCAHYLDHAAIAQGLVPTAYLHGMNLLNGTTGIDKHMSPSGGLERWKLYTNTFISGWSPAPYSTDRIKLKFDPWSDAMVMRIVDGLPRLPDQMWQMEIATWFVAENQPYSPSIVGHCPKDLPSVVPGGDVVKYVTSIVNLGVDHMSVSHPGQALKCWAIATKLIKKYQYRIDLKMQLESAADILDENIMALRQMKYTVPEGATVGIIEHMHEVRVNHTAASRAEHNEDDDDEDEHTGADGEVEIGVVDSDRRAAAPQLTISALDQKMKDLINQRERLVRLRHATKLLEELYQEE